MGESPRRVRFLKRGIVGGRTMYGEGDAPTKTCWSIPLFMGANRRYLTSFRVELPALTRYIPEGSPDRSKVSPPVVDHSATKAPDRL